MKWVLLFIALVAAGCSSGWATRLDSTRLFNSDDPKALVLYEYGPYFDTLRLDEATNTVTSEEISILGLMGKNRVEIAFTPREFDQEIRQTALV